jgi:hypothetical protein
LESGQSILVLTRTDKMDLDVYLGICEKAIVSLKPANLFYV